MNIRYFKLNMKDEKYSALITECEKCHKSVFPNNELSIFADVDNAVALVKVAGATKDWCITHGLMVEVTETKDVIDKVTKLPVSKEITTAVPVTSSLVLSQLKPVDQKVFVEEIKTDVKWNPIEVVESPIKVIK